MAQQAARCMDCGIPYCHTGCPVNNQIPDWNDLVYHADWEEAAANLHSTNNFPEVTGRVCPAPCEAACTLNIIDVPVTIKIDRMRHRRQGLRRRLGEAAAAGDEDRQARGHRRLRSRRTCRGPAARPRRPRRACLREVRAAGGLLRYGIPDFKMEKYIVERRVKQMEAEGVTFHCNVHVGRDISSRARARLRRRAARGRRRASPRPRSPGPRSRRHPFRHGLPAAAEPPRLGRAAQGDVEPILATDKHVVVIGGGDTGSDCIGTSFRQGAVSVTQLEIMPMPPDKENKALTWPNWPLKLRTSSSQAEGAARDFSVATTRFFG